MLIGTAPNVLATHPSRPYKSFADVVAAAKAKPDTITYATIGSGSVGHLTMTLLSERAGCKLVHVPYRGGGPAMNDAIAGHVDLIIGSAALVMPQVTAKTHRSDIADRQDPDGKSAGRADRDRSRVCRLRILRLVGCLRAGRHAEADRRPLRCRARRQLARSGREQDCSPTAFRSRCASVTPRTKQNSSPRRWRCGGRW